MKALFKRQRILLVSDSADRLEVLYGAIRTTGYDVLTAATTDRAVAMCMADHVAAVVLDSNMLRNSAWSVAHTFKMIRANLPVVLLEERVAQRGAPAEGVDAVVQRGRHRQVSEVLAKLLDRTIPDKSD